MSATDVSPDAAGAPEQWPTFNLYERRVLGVLIEKQKTTPDAYPLSLNALVTGCNQKSNRDPVLNLADLDVEEALQSLRQKGLVLKVTGSGRVERWRHNLYDAWHVDKVELAVLADLLLRGAQTEGELRTHVSRMDEVGDLDALRAILSRLAERKLVVYLTSPGQRGSRLTHGFHPLEELETLRTSLGTMTAPAPSGVVAAPPREDRWSKMEQDLSQTSAEVSELRSRLAGLEETVRALQEEMKKLKEALGA